MKKLFALLLAVTLLVSVSVTAFALTTTSVTKKDSGNYMENGKTYYYNCRATANMHNASISMTYDNPKTMIHGYLKAVLTVDGESRNNVANTSDNSSISASVNNLWWTGTYYARGRINSATGTFYIRSYNISTLYIS